MIKTKNGKEIEQWVIKRGGVPAKVKGTKDLIRVKFDNLEDELQPITWYEFFEYFKNNNLTFIYEDNAGSRFCKFIDSDSKNSITS